MSKPEPKFELGDLVRLSRTGKVGIVTKVMWRRVPGVRWLYLYKITGVNLWSFEGSLTLVSSVKGANQ